MSQNVLYYCRSELRLLTPFILAWKWQNIIGQQYCTALAYDLWSYLTESPTPKFTLRLYSVGVSKQRKLAPYYTNDKITIKFLTNSTSWWTYSNSWLGVLSISLHIKFWLHCRTFTAIICDHNNYYWWSALRKGTLGIKIWFAIAAKEVTQ